MTYAERGLAGAFSSGLGCLLYFRFLLGCIEELPSLPSNTFSGQQQRHKLADWGAQAAVQAGISLDNFGQVVFGYNIKADHGSVGNRVVISLLPALSSLPSWGWPCPWTETIIVSARRDLRQPI